MVWICSTNLCGFIADYQRVVDSLYSLFYRSLQQINNKSTQVEVGLYCTHDSTLSFPAGPGLISARLTLARESGERHKLQAWRPGLANNKYCTFQPHHTPPMMRFVPVLGNHCRQTLSGVVVCRSLVISTEQIHARTTTELCRPALRTLLQIGDEGLAVPDNRGSEWWRPTCVH